MTTIREDYSARLERLWEDAGYLRPAPRKSLHLSTTKGAKHVTL